MTIEYHDVQSASRSDNVEVAVMLPDGYDAGGAAYPLILNLHGGGGNRHSLRRFEAQYQEMIADGTLPPCIVASLSAGVSMYMGFEEFVAIEFPVWLAENYNTRTGRENVCVTGASMGGFGTLHIAFQYPDRFCAIAALESAIEPGYTAQPQGRRNTFWRTEAGVAEDLQQADGEGMDWSFADESPARVVRDNATTIRESGLEIYLEVGDEDYLNLQDGTEFLHRVLWDNDIRHEYHLVRWADHVGSSMRVRMLEAHRFLAGALAGGRSESRDLDVPAETMEAVFKALADPDFVELDPEDTTLSELLEGELGPTVNARMHDPMRETAAGDPEMQRNFAKLPPT